MTELRFAMLGMIPGNGHPYSWSAIVNGYDPEAMAKCPYAGIPQYLGAQPFGTVGVPGARVTHIWTDDPAEAPLVAAASRISHVAGRPEDVIGLVDAVFIATDDGFDHVRRARPFVEAGLPVFVDKPLAVSVEDLRTFLDWKKAGARILSSSGMRYAPELDPVLADPASFGEMRWISGASSKTWDNYGIHMVEPAFRILGPGFASVRLDGRPRLEVAHLIHRSGAQVTIPMVYDGPSAFGMFQICGTARSAAFRLADTYTAFRRQIVGFVDYVRGDADPYPFAETVEMMVIVIAGLRSRAEGFRRVDLAEILSALPL
jgi:predicted dehydrogenase